MKASLKLILNVDIDWKYIAVVASMILSVLKYFI